MASSITRIVAFGAKANDNIFVDPQVDPSIAVTLDGGHGLGKNVLTAGAGPTREHGWFGQNTLIGGTGQNQLVGRAGHVKFKPTTTTTEILLRACRGLASTSIVTGTRSSNMHYTPPGGQFFQIREREDRADPDSCHWAAYRPGSATERRPARRPQPRPQAQPSLRPPRQPRRRRARAAKGSQDDLFPPSKSEPLRSQRALAAK